MKQTVIVSGFIVVILITALTILSVESKQDRKDELERVVAAAVKQTVKDSQIKEQKIRHDCKFCSKCLHIIKGKRRHISKGYGS